MKTSILTNEDIRKLYAEGSTYKELIDMGCSNSRISGAVKGMRSISDSCKQAWRKGRLKVDREALSHAARKACIASRKFWTIPEQEFRKILNECGMGVKFPQELAQIINEKDDTDAEIYYQYPIQRYLCDYVDLKNRVVYRVNGDYWHANPIIYTDKDKLSKPQKHNMQQDKNSRTYLERHDWVVIDIWESEIKWNVELVKSKIWATRKTANPTPLHGVNSQFESGVAHWEDAVRKLWFKQPISKPQYLKRVCKCGKEFEIKNKRDNLRKFTCSRECYNISIRRHVRPRHDELQKCAEISYSYAARKYGVSGKTIVKWLAKPNIT